MKSAVTKILALIPPLAVATTGTDQGTSASDVAPGDPAYLFASVADFRERSEIDALEPKRLVDGLPNRQVVVHAHLKTVRFGFSDVAAVGRVTAVEAGEGIFYPNAAPTYEGEDEEREEVVDFADPRAQERSAVVAVRTTWATDNRPTVTFRIGVPPGADPNAFVAGLRGLTDVVVLLDEIDTGRHAGELFPVWNGAALGSIDGSALSFPGLGNQEATILGDVDTVSELKREAAKPKQVLRY